jgi:V/A-type H+-transporting ATPase subunit E
MKTLEKGQDKIKKIADELRNQTLEPAQKKAQEIVQDAQKEAEEIIHNARAQAEKLVAAAKQTNEHDRKVFLSALEQSFKQALEILKQQIETKLFNEQLNVELEKSAANPEAVGKLINAIIESIQKEGISSDIAVTIPKKTDAKAVSQQLAKGVVERLKGGPIDLGNFAAGVQVKLKGQNLTLDITDKTLKEIISRFVPNTFHDIIFGK